MHILTLHRILVQKGNGSEKYVQEGDCIRPRPNLTATLREIVQNGFDEFYTGMTATKLQQCLCRTPTPMLLQESCRHYYFTGPCRV